MRACEIPCFKSSFLFDGKKIDFDCVRDERERPSVMEGNNTIQLLFTTGALVDYKT